MITEDYVSFETAKLLKEKGFDSEECFAFYKEDGKMGFLQTFGDIADYNSETCVLAPTLQMAMKWLREAYKIHINLDIHWLHFANTLGWMYIITKIVENGVEYVDAKGDEDDKHFYPTYEEAAEAAIKHCLENVIQI